ncbi:glycosyltransferase family 2 protein [Candidatus Saccharibacteria bacterium]|nr:glycosyltransferase family 2 protein [Candidatus Saccharibacteria bacterium]
MSKTAFVILNWNCKDTIFDCLDSVITNTNESNIIVVDNGSVDGSMSVIESKYPMVKTIYNGYNRGFSGGVNPGIKLAMESNYKYVALLNPDATLGNKWLKTLEMVLEKKNDVGIATGQFYNPETKSLDGVGEGFSDWLLPYLYGEGDQTDQHSEPMYRSGGSAGGSLYRIELFKEIGMFDEYFFLYSEDTDVSLRAQHAGWRSYYHPDAKGTHAKNSSSRKVPGVVVEQSIRNRRVLVMKNIPGKMLLRHGYKFFFVEPLFAINQVRKGQPKAAIKGYIKAWMATPYALKARRQIMKSRKITSKEFEKRVITPGPPPIPFIKLLAKVMK